MIEVPNTYLWVFTSNMTSFTPDLLSRGVPVRLLVEGDPKAQQIEGDPLEYAKENRLAILGGWPAWSRPGSRRGGRPAHRHRCRRWAQTIGGILDVAGLGEFFLANVEEAEAAMDARLAALADLAEHVVSQPRIAELFVASGADTSDKGKTAGELVRVTEAAGVLRDRLAEASSERAKATTLGNFLVATVDRRVPIETTQGRGTATLRRREARANTTMYFFEIAPGHNGAGRPFALDVPDTRGVHRRGPGRPGCDRRGSGLRGSRRPARADLVLSDFPWLTDEPVVNLVSDKVNHG